MSYKSGQHIQIFLDHIKGCRATWDIQMDDKDLSPREFLDLETLWRQSGEMLVYFGEPKADVFPEKEGK